MANEEQLSILKQGVDVWNQWREEKIDTVEIDLTNADLSEAYLPEINLYAAELEGANLSRTDLSGAELSNSNLTKANLTGSDLNLAHLDGADLTHALLAVANLFTATLLSAHLVRTDFTGASLFQANLSWSTLDKSVFEDTNIGSTFLGDIDFSNSIGLETVVHQGPSTLGTDTLVRSKGKIPEVFLRGCGLSDWEIEEAKLYNPDLSNDVVNEILYRMYDLRATQALQVSPLFVSYSHADSKLVDKLGDYLTKRGIRYWRDTHDMKAGRMEKQIDRAIRQNPTLLLVLSKNSLNSDWVEHEVRLARELEKEMGRDVLCPVALDDSWKSSRWPKRIMEQIGEYNILDFSEWKDESKFDGTFRKLIDGLELFYKG